jgi:hypothetical protein
VSTPCSRAAAGALALRATLFALAAYGAWTAARISLHDGLTSIADDSSNYLVMALHYSPWREESAAIRDAWHLQYFPPLFPLLLAATGAAHSMLAAHALVLVLGACCIAWLVPLLRAGFGLPWQVACGLALVFGLSPGFLLGMQGVLSETLFLLISLRLLREVTGGSSRIPVLVFLLVAAVLTRSAGYVLLMAVAMHAALQALQQPRASLHVLVATAVAGALAALVARWIGPPGQGEYASIWSGLLQSGAQMGPGGFVEYLLVQCGALVDTWCAFFLVYWRDDAPWARLLVLAVGAMGLMGVALRLVANRIDAWYVAASLAMILLWPYPGQMLRLLLPIVPVLLAQAGWCLAQWLDDAGRGRAAWAAVAVLVAVVVLPPHAFLHGRLGMAESEGLVPVHESLRKPDPAAARRELGLQNRILADFASVAEWLPAGARVASYEPSYIALLGGVPSAPMGLRPHWSADPSLPDWVLATAIHPRMSREGIDGLAMPPAQSADWVRVGCSADRLTGLPASCLYRRRM